MVPRAVAFTIVWPEGVIFGSIMTYHVQFLLLVRQPLFDRAALPLTQTSWVLPPLSVGKMTLRLYSALNYSHGLSKGPSFGTGRDVIDYLQEENRVLRAGLRGKRLKLSDDDRRRLAVKAQALGREALAQIASVATPATLLRWYRCLCLLFIHPRAPNLISLRSAGTMLA